MLRRLGRRQQPDHDSSQRRRHDDLDLIQETQQAATLAKEAATRLQALAERMQEHYGMDEGVPDERHA